MNYTMLIVLSTLTAKTYSMVHIRVKASRGIKTFSRPKEMYPFPSSDISVSVTGLDCSFLGIEEALSGSLLKTVTLNCKEHEQNMKMHPWEQTIMLIVI